MGVDTHTRKHGEQTDESLSKFTRAERTMSIVSANFMFSIPCMQELPPPLSKSKGLFIAEHSQAPCTRDFWGAE